MRILCPRGEGDEQIRWQDKKGSAPDWSAPSLAKVVGETGTRIAGLRLAKGALVLKIGRRDAAAQVRLAHAGRPFNPDDGLALRLAFGLDLPAALARVRDLWVIVDAGGRKSGGPTPGSERAISCSPSTAS